MGKELEKLLKPGPPCSNTLSRLHTHSEIGVHDTSLLYGVSSAFYVLLFNIYAAQCSNFVIFTPASNAVAILFSDHTNECPCAFHVILMEQPSSHSLFNIQFLFLNLNFHKFPLVYFLKGFILFIFRLGEFLHI